MTVGTAVAGVLYHATAVSLTTTFAVHSGFTALAFALLAYSLYAETPIGGREPRDDATPP